MSDDLRARMAMAIQRYDYNNGLSGNDMPGKHVYGEVDAVLAALPEADRDEVAEDLATADLAWADHFHREPSDLGRIRALTDCLRAEFYLIKKKV